MKPHLTLIRGSAPVDVAPTEAFREPPTLNGIPYTAFHKRDICGFLERVADVASEQDKPVQLSWRFVRALAWHLRTGNVA